MKIRKSEEMMTHLPEYLKKEIPVLKELMEKSFRRNLTSADILIVNKLWKDFTNFKKVWAAIHEEIKREVIREIRLQGREEK